MIAYLFPGQGTQTPGFLHRLGGGKPHPAITRTLAEASDVLGVDILQLDSAAALASTVAVQIALVVAGVTAARALGDEKASSRRPSRACRSAHMARRS